MARYSTVVKTAKGFICIPPRGSPQLRHLWYCPTPSHVDISPNGQDMPYNPLAAHTDSKGPDDSSGAIILLEGGDGGKNKKIIDFTLVNREDCRNNKNGGSVGYCYVMAVMRSADSTGTSGNITRGGRKDRKGNLNKKTNNDVTISFVTFHEDTLEFRVRANTTVAFGTHIISTISSAVMAASSGGTHGYYLDTDMIPPLLSSLGRNNSAVKGAPSLTSSAPSSDSQNNLNDNNNSAVSITPFIAVTDFYSAETEVFEWMQDSKTIRRVWQGAGCCPIFIPPQLFSNTCLSSQERATGALSMQAVSPVNSVTPVPSTGAVTWAQVATPKERQHSHNTTETGRCNDMTPSMSAATDPYMVVFLYSTQMLQLVRFEAFCSKSCNRPVTVVYSTNTNMRAKEALDVKGCLSYFGPPITQAPTNENGGGVSAATDSGRGLSHIPQLPFLKNVSMQFFIFVLYNGGSVSAFSIEEHCIGTMSERERRNLPSTSSSSRRSVKSEDGQTQVMLIKRVQDVGKMPSDVDDDVVPHLSSKSSKRSHDSHGTSSSVCSIDELHVFSCSSITVNSSCHQPTSHENPIASAPYYNYCNTRIGHCNDSDYLPQEIILQRGGNLGKLRNVPRRQMKLRIKKDMVMEGFQVLVQSLIMFKCHSQEKSLNGHINGDASHNGLLSPSKMAALPFENGKEIEEGDVGKVDEVEVAATEEHDVNDENEGSVSSTHSTTQEDKSIQSAIASISRSRGNRNIFEKSEEPFSDLFIVVRSPGRASKQGTIHDVISRPYFSVVKGEHLNKLQSLTRVSPSISQSQSTPQFATEKQPNTPQEKTSSCSAVQHEYIEKEYIERNLRNNGYKVMEFNDGVGRTSSSNIAIVLAYVSSGVMVASVLSVVRLALKLREENMR
eukprot:Tbor_TRINITY_DN5403_c0_g1::TRINITY_DN5403_c0_g1_i1::g.24268::m.24268